jgi:hypothetical protein
MLCSSAADRSIHHNLVAVLQYVRRLGIGAAVDRDDHAALDAQLRQQVGHAGALRQRQRGAPLGSGWEYVAQNAVQVD